MIITKLFLIKLFSIENNEEEKNWNNTGTLKASRPGTTNEKRPGKDCEKEAKENIQQEVDPKADINNIENKFNPKREEPYWLEDLYDRLERCLLMGKEPLQRKRGII